MGKIIGRDGKIAEKHSGIATREQFERYVGSAVYVELAAPQEGRLGAITVHPGAYVSPGGAALVTISQLHPVLVSFSLPQRNLPDALAALKSRATVVEVRAAEDAPAGGKPQVQSAAVVFVDNVVDAADYTIWADNFGQGTPPSGLGTAVVMVTGAATEFGQVAASLIGRPPETEFDRGTRVFGLFIMRTVLFLVLFVLLVNIALDQHHPVP